MGCAHNSELMKWVKFFIFTQLFTATAGFTDDNYKVIGRGVADKKTGERIQIACAGERNGSTLERGCNELQFLISSDNQVELVGPVMRVNSESKIKKQLKKEFEKHNFTDDLSKNRTFAYTRKIFRQDKSRPWIPADALLLTGVSWKIVSFFSLTSGWVAVPLLIGAGLSSPVVLDILLMPFTLILDAKEKNAIYGFSTSSTEALSDHAKFSWQWKPRQIKSSRFQGLKEKLGLSKNQICKYLDAKEYDRLKNKMFTWENKMFSLKVAEYGYGKNFNLQVNALYIESHYVSEGYEFTSEQEVSVEEFKKQMGCRLGDVLK